ncbi:MAG: alpha/beta hydrolase [Anaerocolumna sp.]|nr:alpha/beta hydrolase [Anaerocolumna sp.]
MIDYTKLLPEHIETYIGENDLFLEIYESGKLKEQTEKRPPLLFVHGAYTGSWMWSKYIPHFVKEGWKCYAMNMRGHYRSRVVDLTRVTFEDYLDDIIESIRVVNKECKEAPILIGFSMGGILSQKIAETIKLSGLILVDTSISKEVYKIAPYKDVEDISLGNNVVPAPKRDEIFSIDESENDIAFQIKYLSMESSHAFHMIRGFETDGGVSIDNSSMTCPSLTISAINSEEDDYRGRATANHVKGEYTGLWGTTHTGLLVGQRYKEAVDRILKWLVRFDG